MSALAIVGGSGLSRMEALRVTREEVVLTPYGEPSAPLTHGVFGPCSVVFLPRHGSGHTIPPHRINYRANLWALKSVGVRRVIAAAAVGAIHKDLDPGSLAVPDQIIDYTWGRDHTLFDDDLNAVTHVDFTYPYCDELRELLLQAAAGIGEPVMEGGTYGATQGPRLETAREIDRLERDGCDMVGMTGMPEAVLAREAGLEYATIAVVANFAAGRADSQHGIPMEEIEPVLQQGLARVRRVIEQLVAKS
jgi:5'-methylthioinosine phosphorylase